MPFKSEAQRKFMWANHPEMAKEWQAHTPKGKKLPEHVKTSSSIPYRALVGASYAYHPSVAHLTAGSALSGLGERHRDATLRHATKRLSKVMPKEKESSILSAITFRAFSDELQKIAKEMPHFTDQDRPEKVKDVYKALKRDHPGMPAEVKARIAARKGKSSPKSRKPPETGGPAYKAPLHYKHKGGKYKAAADLTESARERIKSKNFAEPKKRKYPIEDPAHARNALARVSQFGSPAEKAQIRSKVHAKYPEMGKEAAGVVPNLKPAIGKAVGGAGLLGGLGYIDYKSATHGRNKGKSKESAALASASKKLKKMSMGAYC